MLTIRQTITQLQTEATNLESAANESPKFAAYYRAKASELWIKARTLIKQEADTVRIEASADADSSPE